MDETWEYEIRKLTRLADRQFWWKRRGPTPARAFQSRFLPDVRVTPRLRDRIAVLKEVSNARWARRKEVAEGEIRERQLVLLSRSPSMSDAPADAGEPIVSAVLPN